MGLLNRLKKREETQYQKMQDKNYYFSEESKKKGKQLYEDKKNYIKNNPQDYETVGANIYGILWNAIDEFPSSEREIFRLTGEGKYYEDRGEFEKAIKCYQDAVDLVIGDLMDGTRDYHNFTNVDDFIDHAPSGMICTFEFYPHKTKRFELPCITCIDPETTDLILQNLRRIKNEYLPRINKKYGLNLNLSKEDALFGNQREYFKGPISTHSLSDVFNKKNKKLREHRINQIKEKIEKGEIAEEDFEKEVEKIPKFHAHGLQKFFHTVIAKNCGNLRICAIMEGHTAPLRTDNSYVKIDAKEIKEVYMSAIEDLSLENTEVKIYTSEIRREMEEKINSLENMNAGLQSEIDKMDEIMARLEKLENKS